MFSVERTNEIKSRLKNQGKIVTSRAQVYFKQVSAPYSSHCHLCLAVTPFLSPSVLPWAGFIHMYNFFLFSWLSIRCH